MNGEIVNKVAQSGIITIDPASFISAEKMVVFDLQPFLFKGLILKEKDFREALKTLDLSTYTNTTVTITCSTNAIIPQWAYMLVASTLQPVTKKILFGTEKEAMAQLAINEVNHFDTTPYHDARIVLKGCGDVEVPAAVYVALTNRLQPVVKSIMYGEPCSTVPVYKKK